jgi:hypothetical protein
MAEALVLALGVAASPLPILAVILILGGFRARAKALAFAAAWAGGVAVATGVLVAAVDASGATDDGPGWIAVFELGVAATLVALVLGAAVASTEAELSRGELAAGSGTFVAIGSAGVAVPLGARAALPERAPALLAGVRGFVERHDRAVTVVLGLGIALLFAASGVRHL